METIDITLIQSDQTVKPEVLEVYEYLKIYMDATARSEWLERFGKAWDAIENNMWEKDEEEQMKAQGQIPFVVNKCVKGVQGSAAIVTDQKPEAKFLPIGSGDLYVAELMKRGFDVVWEKNEGSDTIYEFQEDVDIGAHSFLSIKLDKSKTPFGRIEFETEPPDDIYWSATSRKRDYSDTHIIKAKMRTLGYIRDHYPGIDEDDIYFSPVTVEDDNKSSGITTGDNYAEPPLPSDTLDPDTKAQQKVIWEIDAWMLKIVEEDWLAEFGEDGQPQYSKIKLEEGQKLKEGQKMEDLLEEGQIYWPRQVTKRVQRIIVGKVMVEEKVNPEGEDADGEPILTIIGMKAQRTRSSYSMSKTNYARDINREKNKRRIQAIHAASHLINAPLWYTDSVEWTGNPGTPGSVAKVSKDAQVPPVGRVPSGAVDVMQLMRLEEKSDAEIDEMYDQHDVMKGKVPPGQDNMSGRMVLALQDMGGMMSKPALRKLESAIVRLAKVIMAMMLRHWPRYMWDRLLEDEEKVKFAPDGTEERKKLDDVQEGQTDVMIDIEQEISAKWEAALELIRPKDIGKPPGLSLLDVDVKVMAGSSMPTNRIAKGQLAIEKVKVGIYDAEAALEYDDDPNKDKIITRMKAREEAEIKAGRSKK